METNLDILTNQKTFEKYGALYYQERRLAKPFSDALMLTLFGVATAISGQCSSWNFGLQYGFGSMLVAWVISAILYWILACSIAELTSLMPFTGGSSNFATAAFGPLAGAVEGYCFYSELITFGAASLMNLSILWCNVYSLPHILQPVFWFIIVAAAAIVFLDIKLFLRINSLYSIASVITVLLFVLLMIPSLGNFSNNIHQNNFFSGGGSGIFYAIPYAIRMFVGIEVIPFLSEETKNSSKTVPVALIRGMFVLTITSFLLLLVVPGSNPGIATQFMQQLPLTFAVEHNFKLDPTLVTTELVEFIFISAFISSFLGCMMGCNRSMYALSRAGLLNSSLSFTSRRDGFTEGAPYWSVLCTSMMIMVLAAISLLLGDENGNFLNLMCIAYALLSYLSTLSAYIMLKMKLANHTRHFTSPFGVQGAWLGLVIVVIGFASLCTDRDLSFVLIAIACQICLSLLYYFLVVKKRIGFLPEKQFIKHQLQQVSASIKKTALKKSPSNLNHLNR